jgi:hypothetical protein
MTPFRVASTIGLVAAVIAGCSSSSSSSKSSSERDPGASIVWPAPTDPMARAGAAGLVPETSESLQYHVHAHLDVFRDGKQAAVPGGIGIDTNNPGVHGGETAGSPAYGGISVPCDQPCISPLHTHDATGVIHTESATRKNNTFGQFLTEWNVTLPGGALLYVDGGQFTGDPKTIPLSNGKEIAVVIGTPPAKIPSTWDRSLI